MILGGARISDRALTAWAVLAAINMTAAFVVFRPYDFDAIWRWTSTWLRDGAHVYGSSGSVTDYPPNAIVLLSPLAILPLRASAWCWGALNVALALVAPRLAARAIRDDVPARSILLLTLTFLCWSATRTLLQFSLLAVLCSLAAWRLAERRPAFAGVCLGLAAFKPQVVFPYVVWIVVRRQWRPLGVALLTTALLWLAYCARTGVGPIGAATDYLDVLGRMYTGESQQVGVSELARLAPNGWEDTWRVVVALAVGLAIAATILRVQKSEHTRLEVPPDSTDPYAFVPGLIAAGILVTFRHLSYAFVSLLPAAAYLMRNDSAGEGPMPRRWFWALQAGLIVDVPTVYRLAQSRGWSAGTLEPVFVNFDRGFLLAVFVVLIAAALPARQAYRWATGAGT